MSNNRINIVTISQVLEQHLSPVVHIDNEFALLNKINTIELFRRPCRLHALAIMINIGGDLTVSINLREYKVTPENNILLALPENITEILDVNEFQGYVLLVAPKYLRKLTMEITQKSYKLMTGRNCALFSCPQYYIEQLHPYYTILENTITHVSSEADNVIKGLVESFIFRILGLVDYYSSIHYYEKDGIGKSSTNIFEKYLALLSKHCYSERSVNFYAEKLNITPQYLSVVIKEYSGKSPLEWIADYVISEAITMLRTGFSIQQVSFKLNFSSQSAFSKYFKAQTGHSPKEYQPKR